MHCPSCQADIPAGSVRCPRCSTLLEHGELTAETGTPGAGRSKRPRGVVGHPLSLLFNFSRAP